MNETKLRRAARRGSWREERVGGRGENGKQDRPRRVDVYFFSTNKSLLRPRSACVGHRAAAAAGSGGCAAGPGRPGSSGRGHRVGARRPPAARLPGRLGERVVGVDEGVGGRGGAGRGRRLPGRAEEVAEHEVLDHDEFRDHLPFVQLEEARGHLAPRGQERDVVEHGRRLGERRGLLELADVPGGGGGEQGGEERAWDASTGTHPMQET
jgi:hypothetical protein